MSFSYQSTDFFDFLHCSGEDVEDFVQVGLQGSPSTLPALSSGPEDLVQGSNEWQTEGVSQVEVDECSTQQCPPYAVELCIIQIILWTG